MGAAVRDVSVTSSSSTILDLTQSLSLDVPACTESEPNSIFTEDLFQGTSFSDLLQTSPDVNISYYMSDDEPLELAPLLPALMSSELSPTGGSVNVFDMISQDVMFGNSFQNTSSASTEVTYVSQYTSPSATPFTSAAPFTSAGDVFLPSIPITTASNTFVKPLHTYIPPTSRNARTILKPNPRHAYGQAIQRPEFPKPANPSSLSPFTYNPVPHQQSILRTPVTEAARSVPEKSRKSSKKSSTSSSKKSKSRSRTSQKSSSRTNTSKKSSSSRSKVAQSSLLFGSSEQSAFVPTTTRSTNSRSTAVTHTATRTLNTFTKSATLSTETVTYTTTTAAHIGQRTVANAWSSLKATVTSCTATKTHSSAVRSHLTTCTTTSFTGGRSRTPATIISPMQSTFLPSRTLPVISRTLPAAPTRPAMPSPASDRSRSMHTSQSVATATVSDRNLTGTDAPSRSRTRLVIPINTYATSTGNIVTTTATATKHRVVHSVRSTQSTVSVTNVQSFAISTTTASTTAGSRTLTQSTFTLPPGATLYTARKIPSARTTRSRTAMTTEAQTITIVNEKGAYTTLTISSDFTTTTGSPLVVAQTTSPTAVTAGGGSHISADTVIRPRSQLLIPIANSQMNTSTSLGYLVTSPIGSDIITTRNSTAAVTTQSPMTTAAAIGTHTITTISSEALSKIRSRLIYNVPSTAAGSSTLPRSTSAADPNRPRGPVTIIANQLISALPSRDVTGTAARTLFSAASTQSLYALTTPVTTRSSSTTLLDHTGRSVNRVVIPIMHNVHAQSNSQSASSTPGTYILATGMGTVTTTAGDSTRPSRLHNTKIATTALTSTMAAAPTTRAFPGAAAGSPYMTAFGLTDGSSKLRNRLTIKVTTCESSVPGTATPITAYAIRNRPTRSIYAVPAGSATFTSSAKTTETTRIPATMTLLTFAQSSSRNNPRASSPRRVLTPTVSPGNPPTPTTISSITTVTPTLTNTGNHFVIKLGPSGPAASSVTAAVTTPITTAALSPTDHTFLEPHPVPSRLRAFPAPRTYPVAQRLSTGNQQRPPVTRNVSPRSKKVIANPAPLQIFADVVCPPTTAQVITTSTSAQSHARQHFTLSHASGSSTLVVPQYKNTVFKNLSTIAHPNPARGSSRFLSPQASMSDRLVLNRSVALVSPPRCLSPVAHTAAPSAPSASLTQRTLRSERTTAAQNKPPRDSSSDEQDDQFD